MLSVRFLAHGAERSGPPIYLLRLLRHWAGDPPGFAPQVVVARPGELVAEFAAVAPTMVARLDRRSPERLLERLADAAHLRSPGRRMSAAATRARVRSAEPAITVVNGATAPTVELLAALRPTGTVLTVAHELSTGWSSHLDPEERAFLLRRTDRFLAVSRAVERHLVDELSVEPSKVTVVHPPIDVREFGPGAGQLDQGAPHTIVGSGMTDWRKAPELWLRVAAEVKDRSGQDRLRWIWLGGDRPGSANFWPLEHEMRHLGVSDDVDFRGQVDAPSDILRTASVFVSTAREDAYPLACAEAMALGVPVVGFDGDGVAEMVGESGCGEVFPYPRTDLLADAVAELLADPDRRRRMGERGREFARGELDVRSIAPRVAEWIVGSAA